MTYLPQATLLTAHGATEIITGDESKLSLFLHFIFGTRNRIYDLPLVWQALMPRS